MTKEEVDDRKTEILTTTQEKEIPNYGDCGEKLKFLKSWYDCKGNSVSFGSNLKLKFFSKIFDLTHSSTVQINSWILEKRVAKYTCNEGNFFSLFFDR